MTLTDLFMRQETLIQRLQQPSCERSLAVESLGQRALLKVLEEADLQPKALDSRMQAVAWGLQFKDMPTCW